MGEWKERRLDDLVKFQRGHDLTQLEMIKGEYPVAGSNGIIDYHNEYTTKGPGITLGRSGNSIGVAHYYKNNFWAHNTTLYSKEFIDAHPLFVYYFLQTIDFKTLNSGSAVPSLNRNHIHNIIVKVPSLPEQISIATVLRSLDDKIDLLNRQNTTLEKMAETLFRQWFVEEANDDWVNGKVSDLIKILSGFAFKSSSFVESGKYHLITIKGVQDGYLELNNADKIEELPDRMPDFCKLQIGDILLSLTGNVGRCCLVDSTDLLLNQRVAKLHPIKQRDRAYTYFLFRQPQIKQLLEEMGKGTAQSNLSPIETSNMELIIPDEEQLSEFSTIATSWLNKLLFNKKSIQTYTALRGILLPKLMSGEVSVTE